MATAQGQFTIIDYNDAITLTGFISSNLSKSQMYNPDNGNYNPDWSVNNLVLTPSLFVAGSNEDVIASSAVQSVRWYEDNGTTPISANDTYALSGAKSQILTVKRNVLAELPGKDFRVVVSYKDTNTGLTLAYTTSITLSRVVNGSGIANLDVTTPQGNVFKNGEVTSLTAKAELWIGNTINNTGVTYQWYKMDPTQSDGWLKLTNTSNKYTGVTTNTLTVYLDAVDSFATFKCVAKDADGGEFENVASFVDMNDPIYVEILSTGGAFFKNGVGSTTLTAKVYRAGQEIDSNGAGSYSWAKYDADGELVPTWTKTGKSISIGSADVDVKATYVVTVEV